LLRPGTEIWKALRMNPDKFPQLRTLGASKLYADRLLLDTYEPDRQGGTGRTFDWEHAVGLGTDMPMILAGGLNPDNVKKAILRLSPYAVDTSSGVEGDGIKEESKVRAFVEAVRDIRIE